MNKLSERMKKIERSPQFVDKTVKKEWKIITIKMNVDDDRDKVLANYRAAHPDEFDDDAQNQWIVFVVSPRKSNGTI